MSERKAPAGTIAGPTLDTTWQTPPELLEPVRAYFGGRIPLAAADPEAMRRVLEDAELRGALREALGVEEREGGAEGAVGGVG